MNIKKKTEKQYWEKVSFEQFAKDWRKQFDADNDIWTDEAILNIYSNIQLPTRKTARSAGYDLSLPIDINFKNDANVITIPTGLKINLKYDRFLGIFPRSSLGFKYYCMLANTVGIIDADYANNEDNEGHIMVKLWCPAKVPFTIEANKGYAQAIILNYDVVDDDTSTGSRTGGIGSTDKG